MLTFFSYRTKKLGIKDTRGTLFDNIAQMLEAKKQNLLF